MVAPHRAPVPQSHDRGTGLREHAEGSEYRTRIGDLRQSNPRSTPPKNAADITSRLEALTSSSTHDNVITTAEKQVDPTADSSVSPIYQATGSELEDVDESFAPHRIPFTPRRDGSQTKKNPEKSGRNVCAVGDL
jgi:hypothetical protein